MTAAPRTGDDMMQERGQGPEQGSGQGPGASVAATLLRFVRTVLLLLALLLAVIVGVQHLLGFEFNPTVLRGVAIVMLTGVCAGALARLFDSDR